MDGFELERDFERKKVLEDLRIGPGDYIAGLEREEDDLLLYGQDVRQRSLSDKVKDMILGAESAYDAERYAKSGIVGAFDELPRDRREAVYALFENAPEGIKKNIRQYSHKLRITDIKENRASEYNFVDKIICMEQNLANRKYAEVFSHELGHFVDDIRGDISNTFYFRNAMNKDLARYDKTSIEGEENFATMLDALMSSSASYDEAITDTILAFFRNSPEIIQRFLDEDKHYNTHPDDYWKYWGNREAEIFANLFSILSQGNASSCDFIQTYFPDTWEHFNSIL